MIQINLDAISNEYSQIIRMKTYVDRGVTDVRLIHSSLHEEIKTKQNINNRLTNLSSKLHQLDSDLTQLTEILSYACLAYATCEQRILDQAFDQFNIKGPKNKVINDLL